MPRGIARKLSDAEIAALADEYTRGTPEYLIAEAFGIGYGRVGRIMSAQKAIKGNRRQARNTALLADYAGGMRVRELSERYNLSTESVRDILRRAGVTLRKSVLVARVPDDSPLRCACCQILLSESGDDTHEAASVDGLCWVCYAHYVREGIDKQVGT
jgi:hypothetical protein